MSNAKGSTEIKWLPDVEEQDYPAAQSYLLLLFSENRVQKIISALRSADITQFKAKDIFRASELSLLGISNAHIEKDRSKIKNGTPLSPLLLVRGEKSDKLIIADGYHRLCAIYGVAEDTWIRCKIV